MKTNTEVEEWEQEFDKKFPQFLEFEGALHPNLADASDIRFKLKAFFHHQLQKAREQQNTVLLAYQMSLEAGNVEDVLTDIKNRIKVYHSELDQGKK